MQDIVCDTIGLPGKIMCTFVILSENERSFRPVIFILKPQLICRNITVGLCGKDYKPCFCSVDKRCAGLRNAFRAHTPVSHICHKLLEIVSITDIYYRYPSGSGIIHFHTKCSGRIEAYRTLRAYLVIYRPVCAVHFGVKNYPLP